MKETHFLPFFCACRHPTNCQGRVAKICGVSGSVDGTWYLVVVYRGNGGIRRGIYQLQGDDNGHVGRPREVSPARPCPELLCELRGLCRRSYPGPRTLAEVKNQFHGVAGCQSGFPKKPFSPLMSNRCSVSSMNMLKTIYQRCVVRMRVNAMDVRMSLGDAIDPCHLANGFEAVIGYECQERSPESARYSDPPRDKWP